MFSEAAVWVSSATSDSSSPMYTSFLSAATNTNYQEQTQPLRHDSHQCIFCQKIGNFWEEIYSLVVIILHISLAFPNFVWYLGNILRSKLSHLGKNSFLEKNTPLKTVPGSGVPDIHVALRPFGFNFP